MDDALHDKSCTECALASFAYCEREVQGSNGESGARQLSVIDGGCKEAANDSVILQPPDRTRWDVPSATVEISPPEFVRRRVIACAGLTAESVQTVRHAKIEYSFHGPTHLLVIYEDGSRTDGQTCVQGMPRATLQRFARKFTFVPAGHQYREWHELRVLSRLMYFYFDPAKLILESDAALSGILLTPRLFFEDEGLWHTVIELKNLIEQPELGDEPYFQALSTVITHQLLRHQKGDTRNHPPCARRARSVATTNRACVHRRAYFRADRTHDPCAPRPANPVPLLPSVQAITRNAADSLPGQTAYRAREAFAGDAHDVGD
jgi:hypothetical protein